MRETGLKVNHPAVNYDSKGRSQDASFEKDVENIAHCSNRVCLFLWRVDFASTEATHTVSRGKTFGDWVLVKKYYDNKFQGLLDIIGGELSIHLMHYKEYPKWQINLFGSGIRKDIYNDLTRYYNMNNVFSSDFNPDKKTGITLRVVDSSDNPIPNAKTTIEFHHGFMEIGKAHLLTNPEGVATLSTNTSGTIYGGVSKEGYLVDVFHIEFDETKTNWSVEQVIKLQNRALKAEGQPQGP